MPDAPTARLPTDFHERVRHYADILNPLFWHDSFYEAGVLFEYVCTLVRAGGIQGEGWDAYLESQAMLRDLKKLADLDLPADSFSDANRTRTRLALISYCHATEMNLPYFLLANLLRVRLGQKYAMNPFGDMERASRKRGIVQSMRPASPFQKITRIKRLAESAALPDVATALEDIYDNLIRNAVYHSDYVLQKPLGDYEKVKASALAELNKLILLRHPHITYVYDAFEFRDTFYIITERCYCSLSHLMTLQDFNGTYWTKAIARCLLQAVHYIHTAQYVHQDIHVGNVLAAFARDEMDANNPGAIQFKLGDLGVAKLFSEIDSANTMAVWMLPPEVLDTSEFGPLDYRIDIYHCGLLFLHLLHGQELRFTPDEIRSGKPRELALQLAPPYNFALEKALRRHVAYRTASAMELWRDLNSPEPPPEPTSEQLELEQPPTQLRTIHPFEDAPS